MTSLTSLPRTRRTRARTGHHHHHPRPDADSVGIWGERIQGILKPWQAVFFGLGLAADTTGTLMMTRLSAARADAGVSADGLSTVMAVSGTVTIALMAVHLIWAVVVLVRGRRSEKVTFHRFSLVVWAIWLIPYVVGAIVAMTGA